jgi:ActR/RegA family two-component response regulator/uncharacterized membrane protein YeaQ/YmgE (transglycosylase-associated protein family)
MTDTGKIERTRTPWPIWTTGAVAGLALVTSVGTLAEAFEPWFGPWALPVACLLDLIACTFSAWAIYEAREGQRALAARACAASCIGASVAAQVCTHVHDGAGSAIAHGVAPAVLGAVLEMWVAWASRPFRMARAEERIREALRVEIARAATGMGARTGRAQRATVHAARAGIVDVGALARTLPEDALTSAPAMRALCTAHASLTRAPVHVHSTPVHADERARTVERAVHAEDRTPVHVGFTPVHLDSTVPVRERIAAAHRAHPDANASELARITGVHRTTVARNLARLTEDIDTKTEEG